MARRYLPFIDWLKCIGIFLIVCGHVAARPINRLTPPIYPKQLGVALFLFVLGFALANERRHRSQVLFNRLFDMYFYALPVALFISALAPVRQTLNLSNYLPFMFGANVLFDNFPANPTTWFVGTYLHILLVWAVFIRFPVRPWMLAASFGIEIAIRALLGTYAGGYVAYMSLFNWSTVFLLGMWWGQREQVGDRVVAEASPVSRWRGLVLLGLIAAAWATWMPGYVRVWSFPFAELSAGAASLLVTSACVSVLYLAYTFLFFQAARPLAAPGLVRFFARNTLFVFLAHMPVFNLLEWLMRPYQPPYAWFALINMAVCFVGLAAVSEALDRLFAPRALRERLAARLFSGRRSAAPHATGVIA